MKIKVYAPNGVELAINTKKLNECPLCHELAKIENVYRDTENENREEEKIDYICIHCSAEFSSFPLRKFIKLKGF